MRYKVAGWRDPGNPNAVKGSGADHRENYRKAAQRAKKRVALESYCKREDDAAAIHEAVAVHEGTAVHEATKGKGKNAKGKAGKGSSQGKVKGRYRKLAGIKQFSRNVSSLQRQLEFMYEEISELKAEAEKKKRMEFQNVMIQQGQLADRQFAWDLYQRFIARCCRDWSTWTAE